MIFTEKLNKYDVKIGENVCEWRFFCIFVEICNKWL